MMYVFSYHLKNGIHWKTGDALYYALSLETFSSSISIYLLKFPRVLKLASKVTIWMEGYAFYFVFVPFKTNFLRIFVIFLFVFFHLGIAVSMNVGLFPYTCISAFIPLIPSSFIDYLIGKYQNSFFYSKFRFFINFLKTKTIFLYKKKFKTKNLKRCFPNQKTQDLICVFFICYVFTWNLGTVTENGVPKSLHFIGDWLSINQMWNMFSPHPPTFDTWFVAAANITIGEEKVLWDLSRFNCFNF